MRRSSSDSGEELLLDERGVGPSKDGGEARTMPPCCALQGVTGCCGCMDVLLAL